MEKTKGKITQAISTVPVNGKQNQNMNDQGEKEKEETHRRKRCKSRQLNYAQRDFEILPKKTLTLY